MSQSDFFAHLLFAVLPLAIAWGLGREALPGMITTLRNATESRLTKRPIGRHDFAGRLQVSLISEIILALIAVTLGSILAERLIGRFLPELARASAEPTAPSIVLTAILTVISALFAYAIWWLVALFNERIHRVVREEPPIRPWSD